MATPHDERERIVRGLRWNLGLLFWVVCGKGLGLILVLAIAATLDQLDLLGVKAPIDPDAPNWVEENWLWLALLCTALVEVSVVSAYVRWTVPRERESESAG